MANKSSHFGSIDYTDAVIKAVRAGGNPSFADWRKTLIKQGWDADTAKSIKYDPVSGRFLSTLPGGKLTPDEAVMAEAGANPGKRLGAVGLFAKRPSAERQTPQKRGEQTNAGAAEYSDTISTGLAWAKGALPAGTYNDLATRVNTILTSNDPNRYERAARALSVMMDESARQQKAFQDATEGSKVTGDPAVLELRDAAARQFFINDQKNKLAGRYFADALGARAFHDAMDGNIVTSDSTPDSIRAAEYVRQLPQEYGRSSSTYASSGISNGGTYATGQGIKDADNSIDYLSWI